MFSALSAQTEAPFYEEWWFLLVMALSSLILILLVVFALVLHGQSKKYKNCNGGKAPSLCCAKLSRAVGIRNNLSFEPLISSAGTVFRAVLFGRRLGTSCCLVWKKWLLPIATLDQSLDTDQPWARTGQHLEVPGTAVKAKESGSNTWQIKNK